ncbi:MAG: response regulator [Bdellovibrionales bacterium]
MELDKKTILIVDDEVDLREMLEFEFEMAGANVITASNGKEAYELAVDKKPDAIISDIRMPGGDGVELLSNLMKNELRPPLLFISGFSDIQVDEAYDQGASGYFAKPFVLMDIVKKVESLVTPLEERWAIKPASEPDLLYTKALNHSFLDSKDSKVIFGSGGLLISGIEKLPLLDSMIRFDIQFTDFSVSGLGKVKWSKRVDVEVGNVCGLDLVYLDEDCRSTIVDLLKEEQIKPYIPRYVANES